MLKINKKSILIFLTIGFFLGNNNIMFSQKLPEFVSQTPQAAALSKYSEYPIGNYTGVPSINVPLYTIESGDISLPIGLNYHAGGFKVSEEASWVGLGWTLTANGAITRTVNGADDFSGSIDQPGSTYHNLGSTPRIIDITTCTGATSTGQLVDCLQPNAVGGGNNFVVGNERMPDYSGSRGNFPLVNGVLQNYTAYIGARFDWEPDIYSINIMGLNGKFVLDQDQNVYFLDKQDVEVKKTPNGWVARTNDGFQYYFEKKETTARHLSNNEVNGSWYITKMISPTKREMNFFYEEDSFYSFQKTFSETGLVANNAYTRNHSYQDTKTRNVYLNRIEFDNGYVLFIRDTNSREDIKDAKRLKTIQIYNINNTLIKEFELTTSYFTSDVSVRNGFMDTTQVPDSEYSYYKKRLKLNNVIEKNGSLSKTTQFNYSTLNLPTKDSYSQDFWGYYNGQQNSTLLPSYEGIVKINKYVLKVGVGTIPSICQPYIVDSENRYANLSGSNRNTNPSTTTANILQEITYPTGGKTSFEFEANEYYPPTDDSFVYEDFVKDIRKIAKINAPDLVLPSSPMTFDLPSYTLGIEQAKLELIIMGTAPLITNGNTFVEINTPNFSNKYWAYPSPYQPVYSLKIELPSNLQGPITLSLAGIPELNVNQSAYLTFSCRIKKPVTKKFCGGLRMKKIVHSDSMNALNDITKTYNYSSSLGETYGVLKAPIRFMSTGYPDPSNICYVPIICSSSNNNSLSLSQNSLIGYKTVKESIGTNGELGGTIYNYHNSSNLTVFYDFLPAGMPNSVTWGFDGKLKDKSIYNSQNKIVYEESNDYERQYEKIIKSIYQDGFVNAASGAWYGSGGFHYYPIFSRWEPIIRNTKRFYNITDNNYVETKTNYVYNSENLQPSIITTTDSNGNNLITKNYYPNDVNNTNYTSVLGNPLSLAEYNSINQLKRTKDNSGGNGDFKTAQPIQIETYKNTDLLSRQRTTYNTFGNLTLPNFVKTAKTSNTLENRIIYNNYDNKGNPIELQMANGTTISYIWGYKQALPVAKIENATQAQIALLSLNMTLINDSATTDSAMQIELQKLRTGLPNAMVNTYTYKPLVGITSITDPKGDKITYEYDILGRLQKVKDKDGNILSENEYHYKN